MDAPKTSGLTTPNVRVANVSRDFGPKLMALTQSKRFGVMSVLGVVCLSASYLVLSPESDLADEPPDKEERDAQQSSLDVVTSIPDISMEQRLLEPAPTQSLIRSGAVSAIPDNQRNQATKLAGPQLFLRITKVKMTPGLMAHAVLITGASRGSVKARLTQKLVHLGEDILPNGSILLGVATAAEERLAITFDKVVSPDGIISQIKGEALDASDKYPGIKGTWVAGKSLKIAGSIGLNVLSGVADGLQEKESLGGQVTKKSTLKNALLNGTSNTAIDEARSLMSALKDNASHVEVFEGREFLVMFQGDDN